MIIYKHQTLIFMRLANVQSMTAKYMAVAPLYEQGKVLVTT